MSKIMYKDANYGGIYDNKTFEVGSNYIVLGNLLIQWGTASANVTSPDTRPAEGGCAVSFSKAYKSKPCIAQGQYDFNYVSGEFGCHEDSQTTTTGTKLVVGNFLNTATGTRTDAWLAIGEKA